MKKLFIFLVLTQFLQAECQDFSRVPLGMSNGFIKNDQITATSQFNADYYAYTARLKLTGIRWCSVLKSGAPVNYSEYVQVDFKSVVTLTGIATQGDNSYAPNYVKKYYLEVGMDGNQYSDVKGSDGNRQVFTGNTDNNGIVYNWLTVPTKARFVRFRATDASGDHICARLEFYGSKDSRAADRAIYPLGMENEVIEDSQLSHSSELNGNPARNGRLNKGGAAWCVRKNENSEWMQIDFKQPMVITAIATQGHGIASSKDRTYKYYLQYREVGSTTFKYARNSTNGNMLFTGNYKFQNLIVMNLLPVPVTTQFLRINPITVGYLSPDKCLRAEVYGYHPECAGDLTLLDSAKLNVSSSTSPTFANGSTVHSRYAWCANTNQTSEYIKVDLGSIRRITGFGIQGDSENDQWPTRIKVGVSNSSSAPVEMAMEYIGTFGRFHVTRHWFNDLIHARYIQFRPTQVNGGSSVCMRIQVLGCLDFSRVPLGMSNGFIKNDQITATSQFNADYYAYTARLKLTGIRWCSVLKSGAPVNYSEYVQVDFKSVVSLTGIATQGDDSYAPNYVKKYYLEVGMDGNQYSDVKGSDGNRQVFTGNTDNTGIVYAWLTAPARARFVRFRASDVSGAHICVRMEFYGSRDSQAASKVVYPLGMESGVIEDSQLSHSSAVTGNPARNGRLRKFHAAWCANNGNNNEWMQIDFKQPMVITAIATQGHSGSHSVDRTYKYYLQYREAGSTDFKYAKNSTNGNMLFTGNYRFQNLIVMNMLPVPVTTQFLRINPITAGLNSITRCLRAEVYGYHPVCSDDLTSLATITASSSSETGQHAFIYSRTTWCASSSDYLDIDLMMPRMVTGVGIQGDSNNEQWVKTFTLSHGLSKGSMQQTGRTYTANNDRNSIVRNWLLPPLFARFIRISVDTFQTAACMRIQILGCSKDYAVLRSITSTVVNMRTAVVSWGVVYNASSSFTLQYRKIDSQAWMEITNLDSGSVSLPNLEKYQNYIVRLKSSKGILMLKNYVFGGTFSETSKFKLQTDPRIEPKHGIPAIVTTYTVTIFWQQLTQNEILDWDVTGFNIIYKCIDGPGSTNCNAKEVNISNAEAANFTASNLTQYTNYTFIVSVYNAIAKGPKSTINVKTEGMKKIDVAPKVHFIRTKTSSIDIVVKDDSRFIVFGYHIAFRCIATSETRDCVSSKWTNLTAAKNSTTIYGLVSWTKYELRIASYNKLGDSPVNISFATTLESAPSVPPTGITVTNVNKTEVAFSWQTLKKNDTNGELVAFAVKLVRLDTSMEIQWNISSSLQNFIASGLKAYANYSISIAAVNRAGVGPYSTSVIIETLQSAPTGSPIISNAQPYTFSVMLTITNIDKEKENGPLIGYKTSYACVRTAVTRECSSTIFYTKVVTGIGKTQLNLESLSSWTRYSVKVNVYNTIGDGPYSAIANFTTLEEPPSVPPNGITATNINATAVALSWETLKKNDTNGQLVAFAVKLVRLDTSMEILRNVSSSLQSFIASRLKPYTNFSVTIAAVNRAGVGPYSKPFIIETRQPETAAPNNVSATAISSTSVLLTWSQPTSLYGVLHDYKVRYKLASDGGFGISISAGTQLNYTIRDLRPFSRYAMQVQASTNGGLFLGIWSSSVTTTTLQGASSAPSNVSAAAFSSTKIIVTWRQPVLLNGDLHDYKIRYKLTSDLDFGESISAGMLLNYTISGLRPYAIYNIQVQASTNGGLLLGGWSSLVIIMTLQGASTAPNNVSAAALSSTSIFLSWTQPLSFNGVLHEYNIRYKLASDVVFGSNISAGRNPFIIISSLQSYTAYDFQVAASTNGGVIFGNWSLIVRVATRAGVIPQPTLKMLPPVADKTIRISLGKVSSNFDISWYRLFFMNGNTADCSKGLQNNTIDHVSPSSLPLTLQFKPGVKAVQGTTLEMGTLGNYTLCFQALSQEKRQSHSSKFVSLTIERTSLKKVDPLIFQSRTVATVLMIPLAKGPVSTKSYHIIVMEGSTSSRSPDEWLPSELGPYDEATHKAGIPYITGALSSYVGNFSIGDGQRYPLSNRRRRNVGSVTYKNVPLKANTKYLVFQRAYVSQGTFYSSPWLGPLTTKIGESNAKQPAEPLGTAIIVGINSAVFVAILLMGVVLAFIVRRRNSNHPSKAGATHSEIPMGNLNEHHFSIAEIGFSNEEESPAPENLLVASTADGAYQEIDDGRRTYEELRGQESEASYQKLIKKPKSDHAKPKPSLQKEINSAATSGLKGVNLHKNRRWSLVADDENRVILQEQLYDNFSNSDYINAIYVEGNSHKHEYIATQHPLENTISDFWRMVYQQGVRIIVMLNQMKEDNMNLPVFWPSVGKRACHREVLVRANSEISSEESLERKFTITHGNAKKEGHEVRMLHFEYWPDKSLPKDTNKLLKLVKKVDDLKQQESQLKPVVVMCRDGGSRTGAFLAISISLSRFKSTQTIDVFVTAQKLRSIRPQFMENMEVYEFCHNSSQSFIDSYCTEM